MSVPYAIGSCAAAEQFGMSKQAWLRLGLAGTGALLGSSAANKDEKTQGAIMGGVGGFLAGHGLSSLGGYAAGRARALGEWGLPKLQNSLVPGVADQEQRLLETAARKGQYEVGGSVNAPKHIDPENPGPMAPMRAAATHTKPRPPANTPGLFERLAGPAQASIGAVRDAGSSAAARVYGVGTGALDALRSAGSAVGGAARAAGGAVGGVASRAAGAVGDAAGAVSRELGQDWRSTKQNLGAVGRAVAGRDLGRAGALLAKPRGAFRKFGGEKIADITFGANIPGTPFGGGLSSKSERLPGMHKWVPRSTIEQAYAGLDAGLDPADVVEQAGRRGSLVQPLLGAGAGAALTHFGLPSSGNMGKMIGGLVGGGLAAGANSFMGPLREDDMREALTGVTQEQRTSGSNFPITGQTRATASASTPMLLSSAGGLDG